MNFLMINFFCNDYVRHAANFRTVISILLISCKYVTVMDISNHFFVSFLVI